MQTTEGRAGRVRGPSGCAPTWGARWWPTPSGPPGLGGPPLPGLLPPGRGRADRAARPDRHRHPPPEPRDAQHCTVKAGDRSAEDAALRYVDSPVAELRGLVRLDWDARPGWSGGHPGSRRMNTWAPTARPWRASCSRMARMPGVHSAGCRSRKPCLRQKGPFQGTSRKVDRVTAGWPWARAQAQTAPRGIGLPVHEPEPARPQGCCGRPRSLSSMAIWRSS
jgi:hypothetical protein